MGSEDRWATLEPAYSNTFAQKHFCERTLVSDIVQCGLQGPEMGTLFQPRMSLPFHMHLPFPAGAPASGMVPWPQRRTAIKALAKQMHLSPSSIYMIALTLLNDCNFFSLIRFKCNAF